MVYTQPRIHSGEWDAQTSQGFWNTNRSPNLCPMTRLSDSLQKKKKACPTVDLAILADHRIKLKESEKRD